MQIIVTTSLITAFLAGTAALLAPCCIGVLLPSYLASIFKTKTKIFLMTFVYFLGLFTVFLPLGLGVASLSQMFSRYHVFIFTLGGALMLFLGLMLIAGKTYALPLKVHPKLRAHNTGSVYVLGVFSGIATTCCAPVLAGVLALSALPGTWGLGIVYSLAYVSGMVAPLFVIAALIDKTNLTDRLASLRRQISYKLFGQTIQVNLSNFISGLLFAAIGIFILAYARRSPETLSSLYQLNINIALANLSKAVTSATKLLPEPVWAVVFLAIFGLIAWSAWRQATSSNAEKE